MTKEEILQMINAYIVENNTGAITAAKLNELLSDITNIVSSVINNVTSTSTTDALSANMGKHLQGQIDGVKGGMRYLGIVDASQVPTSGITDGDTYRIQTEGTVGSLTVEKDDIITYKNGGWQMFADHRESYIQWFTSPDYDHLLQEHGKGHIAYISKRWKATGNIETSFLYRANQYERGGVPFFAFCAIEPLTSGNGIRVMQYELREGDEAWTEHSHTDYTIPSVINNVTSTSTTDALSANMGKHLQEQIDAIEARLAAM